MSQIDDRFQQLRGAGRKAFVPFITAGDPDLDFTQRLVLQLSEAGASIIEIGFPYSDPIADGPVIQASYTRALENNISVARIFAAMKEIAPQVSTPLVAMVSYAIILRHGMREFVQAAQEAGFAGAIVPDLLIEESDPLRQICDELDFSLIQLVTPTTPRERAVKIAQASSGFLYYVSVAGITGERNDLPPDLIDNVQWLRKHSKTPICIGFGISLPEHVERLSSVADGVIVGSAIVRRIQPDAEPEAVLQDISKFANSLQAALDHTPL